MKKVTIKTAEGRRARHPDGRLVEGEQEVTWSVHYERLKGFGDIEIVEPNTPAPAKAKKQAATAAPTQPAKEA